MSGYLLLLGLGIATFTLGGLFGDGDGSSDSEDETSDASQSDVIVGAEFQTDLIAEVGEDEVVNVSFVDGPLNVDTGEGVDIVIGGSEDDQIVLGSGDDTAAGGAGDDTVDLGSGDDVFGAEVAEALSSVFDDPDLGDDTISGGEGNDQITDLYGANILDGGAGDDLLQAVDASDEGIATPDQLNGGEGDDRFEVDEGDTVITGTGNDNVSVILGDGLGDIDGVEAVVIEDFDIENDALQLDGEYEADDLSIEVFEDGTGSTVFWNDTAVVRVVGGQDLTLSDILLVA